MMSDNDPRKKILRLNQTLQMALFERIEELSAKNSQISNERRRFQNLFNRAPVGHLTLDQGNIIREANAMSALILISPSRRLMGENFSNFISPEFRDAFCEHRKNAQLGKRHSLELGLLTTIKRPVYARLETCLDSDSRFQVAIVDITERKIAEDALKRTGDELQFLCERLQGETVSRRKAEEELRRFALKLIDVQESERQKIAQELHDNFGQLMTYLGLLLDKAKVQLGPDLYRDAKSIAQEVLSGIRNLSADLQPSMLRSIGLGPSLQALFARYMEFTKIRVEFECDPACDRLSGNLALAAYRIVQEALTNIARHACVDSATVRILSSSGNLRIEVEDKGRGFIRGEETDRTGLTGMKERAHSFGGELWVDSEPGEGTKVRARIPLPQIPDGIEEQQSEIS
jgi:signal transduction histidine kinase